MSRQRCHNRARQRRYLLPPVALALKIPYVGKKLFKLRYVEILDFGFISTYFLLGMWFKKISYNFTCYRGSRVGGNREQGKKTVKFIKKILLLVTRTTEISVGEALL